ncbi:CopG family transcriptional regulator [Pseudorhodoferax sp. Leaf267]|uniref:ribbon-helix-helix domain-containing protein n=1 Tax=Pseudorhodoferax sp. Leaf267 TaxID=1736316 RepID=UPI0012E201A7|nr:CopG family transcriptional regulator [Pseudorhodoferax sp. Leaf267]
MNTLTIKISPVLEQQLLEAADRAHLSKSELVRRALAAYVARPADGTEPFVSALDRAGDLVGCFEGGPADLASNPRHLDGFGRV